MFIKTEKNGRYGLVSYRHLSNEVSLIASPKYEIIFDAGEYTFDFVENGNVGFMSLSGRIAMLFT